VILHKSEEGSFIMATTKEIWWLNGIAILFFGFETGSHYVTQAGFKLRILLPQPPEGWNQRQVPPTLSEYSISSELSSLHFLIGN
jgi:hypothetical protein